MVFLLNFNTHYGEINTHHEIYMADILLRAVEDAMISDTKQIVFEIVFFSCPWKSRDFKMRLDV